MSGPEQQLGELAHYQDKIKILSEELLVKEKILKIQKVMNKSLSQREKMYKTTISQQKQQIQKLRYQLQIAINGTQSIQINFQSKSKLNQDQNDSLLRMVQQLEKADREQKEQNNLLKIKNDQMSSKLKQFASSIHTGIQNQEFDLPILLPEHSKEKQTQKEGFFNTIKQQHFNEKQAFENEEMNKIILSLPKIDQDMNIHQLKLDEQQIQVPKSNDEQQSCLIILNEKGKPLNFDDEDFQIPPKVPPINKKIMQSIMKHYEDIQHDKKWTFLQMISAWAELKMEKVCLDIIDMQN